MMLGEVGSSGLRVWRFPGKGDIGNVRWLAVGISFEAVRGKPKSNESLYVSKTIHRTKTKLSLRLGPKNYMGRDTRAVFL